MRKQSHSHRATPFLVLAAVILSLCLSLPAAAGLFEWSHLGRLIPQAGFEPSVSAIAGHPTAGSVVYAGTLRSTDNTNLVFRSDDAGLSWQAASGGLPANMPQNTGVNDLLIRQDEPTILYAGLYKAGVWQSTNGGQSWANATNGSIAANDTVIALSANSDQPKLVYALTGTGMHLSFDGNPWQARNNGLPASDQAQFTDLAADPTDPGTVYLTTNPFGVYRTENDGQTWQQVNDGLPAGDLNVRGIAVSPAGGRVLVSIAGHGLWRSDNQGDSWTRSDSGITYNTTLQGNVGIPAFSPTDSDIAYVYNNDGVFSSNDGGKTWTPFNDGFTGAETVNTMAFHAAAPDTIYAGTSVSGVWSLTVVPGGRFYVPVAIR
jgi:photosystem II stability/assembly factor-like uncharacterized protein